MPSTKLTQNIRKVILSRALRLSPAATHSSSQMGLLTSRREKGSHSLCVDSNDLTLRLRYINIDYAVASALKNDVEAGVTDVVLTYDIACQ